MAVAYTFELNIYKIDDCVLQNRSLEQACELELYCIPHVHPKVRRWIDFHVQQEIIPSFSLG